MPRISIASLTRLVLDTNIWLDWLVFDNAEVAPIKAAFHSGAAVIFIDTHCERELERVLAYPRPKRTLDGNAQAACLAECRKCAQMWQQLDECPDTAIEHESNLPVCRDKDDQKFLELARDCRADFLVTRDRDLLLLARRKVRAAPFRIVTPRQIFCTAPPLAIAYSGVAGSSPVE
jgi:putative PIN family toxin of toxin-antitoxin system